MKQDKMRIEQWPVEKLLPYARNARTHSAGQVAQIAASINEFGWTNPVLIDGKGNVIAGHGRLEAARSLGMKDVPVIVLDHLSDAQRRAYIIADNQIALNSGWDKDLLALELMDLKGLDFDLDLTGFSGDSVMRLLGDPGEADDDTPPLPVNPVTRPGDLWLLGEHRLLCGDATSADDVAQLLGGAKPHLMVTDPPYGVEYDANWRNQVLSNKSPRGKVANDDRADWREAWALFPGDVAYVWHAGLHASTVQASLEAAGFVIRYQIIWAKSVMVIGRGDYHWKHEPCWYAVRKGATGHWSGDRSQTTLWEIDKPRVSETGHSTQKPVECMRRPMLNNSKRCDAVYDPFVGSGTSIIAAEDTGRVCYAMEITPAYVDVAVKRWETHTGMKAELASTVNAVWE